MQPRIAEKLSFCKTNPIRQTTLYYGSAKQILNAPAKLLQQEGYGAGYVYDHATEEGVSGQDYFPEGLDRQQFYSPRGRDARRQRRLNAGPACAFASIILAVSPRAVRKVLPAREIQIQIGAWCGFAPSFGLH
jgi:hypothetical protein